VIQEEKSVLRPGDSTGHREKKKPYQHMSVYEWFVNGKKEREITYC
jgi:hypothetical protein